jgi:hypothetical protein
LTWPGSWENARASHQAAVAEFVAAAGALSPAQWDTPLAPGKWSPSEIAEHVRLTYEVLANELEGRPGLRIRTPPWLRIWLRFRYLGGILRSGRFPQPARAPKEVRPGPGPFVNSAVLAALLDAAVRCETKLRPRWHDAGAAVTHHLFGRLPAAQALRLVTVHTQHHRAQLPVGYTRPEP